MITAPLCPENLVAPLRALTSSPTTARKFFFPGSGYLSEIREIESVDPFGTRPGRAANEERVVYLPAGHPHLQRP
jgi:hypothetical protein